MEPEKKKLNIIAVSDTHEYKRTLEEIAKMTGDIFIHGGDFTRYGYQDNFKYFYNFLDRLKFKHKIVIAGNHEIALDQGTLSHKSKAKYLKKYACSLTRQQILTQLKKRCIYLEHQAVEVQGIKIFGSPYTPLYGGSAFQYPKQKEKIIWDEIPEGVDILVTHGPPHGILDLTSKGQNAGSHHLQKISKLRKPKYHIFGHIHEAEGMLKINNTTYVNMSNNPVRIIL